MCTTADATPVNRASTWDLGDLAARIQGRLSGRVRHFQLETRSGGLILKGLAATYYTKQLAQHAVMRETDLPILSNEIVVS